MTGMQKGVAVAVVHVVLVSSLGAKLLYDRATRPRVWVKTVPFDPNLPIRGRYVNVRLEMTSRGFSPSEDERKQYEKALNHPGGTTWVPDTYWRRGDLSIEEEALLAVENKDGSFDFTLGIKDARARLNESIAFFIPETVKDPSVLPPGEELWVEVTLPKKGPPRPIRLGVMKDHRIAPLDLR